MAESRAALETELNDLRREVRQSALAALVEQVAQGEIELPTPRPIVNLHCHTSCSYNGYGYSPSYIVWKARCQGLCMAGCVDFDVLDAVDEFLAAADAVGLRACAGMETRVFVREFETRVINSPGEPGIAYHMGMGFTSSQVPDTDLLAELKTIAQDRNRAVLARLNPALEPVAIDYDRDVLPLTPYGNATERHLCAAYDHKARELYPGDDAQAAFWAAKLGVELERVQAVLDDPPGRQALIRSKTMKAGGVGYVQAAGPDFPALDRVNALVLEAGAIPTMAWLDGLSQGEQAIDELLDVMLEAGAAAVNIIPDRSWNVADAELKKVKVAKLYEFVDLAQAHDLPIVVGTEMNARGQPFVDDFAAPEMHRVTPAFLDGAYIMYAHTLLQTAAGMGYLSGWARRQFSAAKAKNAFFRQVGKTLEPKDRGRLGGLSDTATPKDVLARLAES